MSDVVIRAEGLGKKYLIGHESQQERNPTFRDVIVRTANGLARSARDMMRGRQLIAGDEVEEFWALKDVDFEIKRGDVVGIIGRNGAGKSTLLKILSRITEPSAGRVEIKGRVASLLEVGTGFHPELTGRENIFLNGAILGMSSAEIKRKFDEIVAFAEVEKFLDTPVKRYSSGMYVRLAFAVAAHLEPEILIVDEVLAVGDAEFQKKCLGKMQDVAGHGRTVLFVSHNMAAVSSLCARAVLLIAGEVAAIGSVSDVIQRYSSQLETACSVSFPADTSRPSITAIQVDQEALLACNLIADIEFTSPWPIETPIGGVVLSTTVGHPVWGSNARFHERRNCDGTYSSGVLRFEAHNLPLTPDHYVLSAWLGEWRKDFDQKIDAISFFLGKEEFNPLRPPTRVNGHLDWPAVWSARDGV